jgi:branched-chain amino acid transport system permease protein
VGAWFDANLVSVLNGVAIGSLLFILATGLSLVFGMMDVLNLAHGATFLVGAYAGWRVGGTDPSWGTFLLALAVALGIGLLVGAGMSALTEPLRNRSHLDQALLTLGVALIVTELLSMAFGNDVQAADAPPGLDGTVAIFGSAYPTYRLVLIGIGAAFAVGLWVLMSRTVIGTVIRATVADRDMVSAIGIDNRRVTLAVFAVGSALAAVAGVLGGPIYGARPGLDSTVLILALVVVVIGGLGSMRGALVGALVIGQIESLGRAVLADAASFLLFGALAIVLVLRPQGLFAGAAR